MRKLLALGAALMLVLVAACDQKGGGDGKITIMTEISGDVVNIIYMSDSKMEIVYGIVAAEEMAEKGGKEGVAAYAAELLAGGNALTTSKLPYTYSPEIAYSVEYYAYAAEISGGAIVGEVVVESVKNVKSYISYMPTDIVTAPAAISDNGRYMLGSIVSLEVSVIYDIATGEEIFIDGATLYDITDDGKFAVGMDGAADNAAVYENGEVAIVSTSGTGTLWAVTPDGKTAVGRIGGAVKYENGAVAKLSLEGGKGFDGVALTSSEARGIGTNGVVAGFANDPDTEGASMGVYWTADGQIHVIGEGLNAVDAATESWLVYGGFTNGECIEISPNGKYVAGTVMDAVGIDTKLYPYIVNTETGELHTASAAEFAQYNEVVEGSEYSKHPRVDAVTNEGEIIMTVTRGGESDVPYIYTIDGGMQELESYLEKKFGVDIEPAMKGTCACVSANGRTFVLTHQVAEGYMTEIYSL